VVLTHPPLVVRTTLPVLVPPLKSLPKETGWPTLVPLVLMLVVLTGTPLLLKSLPGREPNCSSDDDIAWFDDLSYMSIADGWV
jgi:hypothetical protein